MGTTPLAAEHPTCWPPPGPGKGWEPPEQRWGPGLQHVWSPFSRGMVGRARPHQPPSTAASPLQAPGSAPSLLGPKAPAASPPALLPVCSSPTRPSQHLRPYSPCFYPQAGLPSSHRPAWPQPHPPSAEASEGPSEHPLAPLVQHTGVFLQPARPAQFTTGPFPHPGPCWEA